MSLIFTEQLDKPSELRSKPSNLLRPIFGALYGFDSTAIATNTFTTLTVADTDTNAIGSADTITFTVQPSVAIAAGGTLTLTGMQGTQTANNASLTVGGAGAAIFGSSGSWTQSTGTLVLTVAGGQSLPTGSDTVITFDLTNASSVQSGKTVSVSSNTFTTANATGTVLDTVANFNVTTRDTEANILASTPTNPTDEVNIAFGTDTGDFYIYTPVGSWLIYNDFRTTSSVELDGSDDYISLGSSFTLSGAWSASFWVKPDSFNINLFGNSSSGSVYLFIGGDRKVRVNDTIISNALSQGVWQNIVITRDGSNNLKGYVNGSLQVTTTSSDSPTVDQIGRYHDGTSGAFYNGLMDEVSTFNTALSAYDITSIYNGGNPSDISSLNPIAWWRMGENDGGTGTTVTDQGSGGNNGTLTNGATFSTTVPS